MELSDVLILMIPIAVLLGLFMPGLQLLKPYIMLCIAIIIWAAGLHISPTDLMDAIKKPKQHTLLVLILFIIHPILIWLIFSRILASPLILAGFVLVAAAPVAAATPFITHLAKGDVHLALTFTGLSHLVLPFTLPPVAFLLLNAHVSVSMTSIAKLLALVIIVPLLIALPTAKHVPRLKKYSSHISLIALFIALSTVISLNRAEIFNATNLPLLIGLSVIHCTIALGTGLALSRGWSKKERTPFLIGLAIRNNAIVMALAILSFGTLVALPIVLVLIVQLFFLGVIVHFFKR